MKKVLLAFLGFVLIGILTYFCFETHADTIRQDLETNANNTLIKNHLFDAKAELIGNGFETTTIIKLTGKAPSIEVKKEAERLVGTVLGVSGIDNQLMVKAVIEQIKPIIIVPSPYLFDASKDKNGHVALNGYIDNEDAHLALVTQAHKIFGKQNTTDNLKVAKGAPEHWENVANFGLEKLKEVDYGDMKLHDTYYAFNGHISSPEAKMIKLNILEDAKLSMEQYDNYSGEFEISIPAPIQVNNSKLCQKALINLSSRQKILFEYNRADIKKDSITALNNIVKTLKSCKFTKTEIVEIGGHTDSIGEAPFNKKLSQKRADTVKDYLIKQGIEAVKLISHGYGEKAPIVSNMLKAGRAKNRRIEFIIKEVK